MIIMRELNDPRLTGMPSITRVKVSRDLSIADVYVTIMGTPGQQTAALNALKHSAGLMRTKLTKALTLRRRAVPEVPHRREPQEGTGGAGPAREGRRGERRAGSEATERSRRANPLQAGRRSDRSCDQQVQRNNARTTNKRPNHE